MNNRISIFPQILTIPRIAEPKQWCKICGKETKYYHFGALSCLACSSFFYRSVTLQRTYRCKFLEKCQLFNLYYRRICKYCRFKKCLAVGMQPCKVGLVRYRVSSSCDSSTTRVMLPRSHCSQSFTQLSSRASFTNEIEQTETHIRLTTTNPISEYQFQRELLRMDKTRLLSQQSNNKQTEVFFLLQATILESLVCTAYTNSTALSDYLSGKDKANLLDQATISWNDMNVCSIIAKNNRTNLNSALHVNEQFVDLNLQFIEKFYQLDKSFRSSEWIKTFKKPLWQKVLDLAKILENNKLNEYEFAALSHLTLIQIARETLGNIAQTEIDLFSCLPKLVKDIQQCYPLNAAQISGSLMQLVDEMHKLRKKYNTHILIVFLSQKASSKEHNKKTFVNPMNQEVYLKDFSTPQNLPKMSIPFL